MSTKVTIDGVTNEQLKESIHNVSDKLIQEKFIGDIHPESIEGKKLFNEALKKEIE